MSRRLVIVDYGVGNLLSAGRACVRAAEEVGGWRVVVSSEFEDVAGADGLILPGVGAFAGCVEGVSLEMRDALEKRVREEGCKMLGICVGMQLMAEKSLENGEHEGWGWLAGRAEKLASGGLPLPHMGWNEVQVRCAHPVMEGVSGGHCYFANGYGVVAKHEEDVVAVYTYGEEHVGVMARENWCGVQFHPEKSQGVGLRILANFLRWQP